MTTLNETINQCQTGDPDETVDAVFNVLGVPLPGVSAGLASRRGRSTNAARYVVALAATSLIALTGCGDTYVAAPEPTYGPAVETLAPFPETLAATTTAHNPVVVPPTAPPASTTVPHVTIVDAPETTAHNPVVAPPTAPAQSSTETYDPCPNVSTIGTSAFVPTDWEQWCLGVANGAASLVAEQDGGAAMCEAWAILSDTELLATFEVNFNRSYAIGILDALWKLCAA